MVCAHRGDACFLGPSRVLFLPIYAPPYDTINSSTSQVPLRWGFARGNGGTRRSAEGVGTAPAEALGGEGNGVQAFACGREIVGPEQSLLTIQRVNPAARVALSVSEAPHNFLCCRNCVPPPPPPSCRSVLKGV